MNWNVDLMHWLIVNAEMCSVLYCKSELKIVF